MALGTTACDRTGKGGVRFQRHLRGDSRRVKDPKTLMATCFLWVLCCGPVPLRAQTPCDAAQVWEKLIAAKGGRVRLEGVRALFIRERGTRWGWLSPRRDTRILYVMPSSLWQNPPNFGSGTFEFGHRLLIADFGPNAINPRIGASGSRHKPAVATKAEERAGECGFSTPAGFQRQPTCAESSSS